MATKKKAGAKKGSGRSPAVDARAPRRRIRARGRSPRAKRKPNAAFMKPMTISPQLGTVIGTSPMPRTEVTKKLWAYIKRKGLQDSKNRRMINADENLKPIFGGKAQVSMFDMTKMVSKHLK